LNNPTAPGGNDDHIVLVETEGTDLDEPHLQEDRHYPEYQHGRDYELENDHVFVEDRLSFSRYRAPLQNHHGIEVDQIKGGVQTRQNPHRQRHPYHKNQVSRFSDCSSE